MFTIAQISDTHLSDGGDITLDACLMRRRSHADRLLHDGFGLPVCFLPGNHDLGDSQDSPGHDEAFIDAARRRDLPKAEAQEVAIGDAGRGVGAAAALRFSCTSRCSTDRSMSARSPAASSIPCRAACCWRRWAA